MPHTDRSPICKCLVGWICAAHVALRYVPMFREAQKYVVCKVPGSAAYRLLTSKLCFVDTKDAVLAALLIYYFRTFERRYGSSRFVSFLAASFVFSAVIETTATYAIGAAVGALQDSGGGGGDGPLFEFNGLLAIGP